MTIGMGRTTCIRFIDRRLLTGPLGSVALRVGSPCGFFGPSSVPRSWVYTVAFHLRGSVPRHLCCGFDFSIPSLFHGAASFFFIYFASFLVSRPRRFHIASLPRKSSYYPHKVGDGWTPYRIFSRNSSSCLLLPPQGWGGPDSISNLFWKILPSPVCAPGASIFDYPPAWLFIFCIVSLSV